MNPYDLVAVGITPSQRRALVEWDKRRRCPWLYQDELDKIARRQASERELARIVGMSIDELDADLTAPDPTIEEVQADDGETTLVGSQLPGAGSAPVAGCTSTTERT